jgi:hypothetical protein
MSILAEDTMLHVGDTITVSVILHNNGCVDLGMPLYRLYLESEGHDVLAPTRPEPIEHGLAVDPGESDSAEFALRAVAVGEVALRATASFEVHLRYPGPAYWGGSGTSPLVVTVVP